MSTHSGLILTCSTHIRKAYELFAIIYHFLKRVKEKVIQLRVNNQPLSWPLTAQQSSLLSFSSFFFCFLST